MKKLFVSLLIFANIQSFAQPANVARLDSFFNVLSERNLAMGSLAISQNGIIKYQKAIGFSEILADKKVAANIDTKYKFGSVTKLYTAILIFQLIEEGKLTLDQKLSSHFPMLSNAEKITIGNLLNHRSGLHNYTEGTNFPDWMDKPKTREELLNIIKDKGIDFQPNEKADYCNTNYLLLGFIVENLTRKSYQDALNERIISKIGLKNTYIAMPTDISKNESFSYKFSEGAWKQVKETFPGLHQGAGAIVSTPTDMVKFIEAVFNGKLVKKSSLDEMKTMTDGYGMGLSPYNFDRKTGLGHNGRIEEFYSIVRYFPDQKVAFSYVTNGIDYPRSDIVDGILKIYFAKPFEIPFSQTIVLKDEDFDKLIGSYASDQMQLVVNCTRDGDKLLLETKGHIFDVRPIAKNYFMHIQTGTFFEFFPETKTLQIKETDNIYYLKKKEQH